MKKTLLLLAPMLGFLSCQNEEITFNETNITDTNSTIQLVTIDGDKMHLVENSRNIPENISNIALKFENYSVYETTLQKLKGMTETERINYIQQLGLISLQSIAQQADLELDKIGEKAKNESQFKILYKDYLTKYEGILIQNEYDHTDLSLYVPDGDNLNTYLMGPISKIVIGNKIKTIPLTQDMSNSDKVLFTPRFSPTTTRSSADVNGFQQILNGSKKTTCSVYLEQPSLFITVSIGIQKKMWYGWKRDNNRDIYYEISLTPFVYNYWGPYGNQINISKPSLYVFRQTGKIDYKTGYYLVTNPKKPLVGNIWVWHDILLNGASQKTYKSVVIDSNLQEITLPECIHNDDYSCSISFNI